MLSDIWGKQREFGLSIHRFSAAADRYNAAVVHTERTRNGIENFFRNSGYSKIQKLGTKVEITWFMNYSSDPQQMRLMIHCGARKPILLQNMRLRDAIGVLDIHREHLKNRLGTSEIALISNSIDYVYISILGKFTATEFDRAMRHVGGIIGVITADADMMGRREN